jgi:hypothetical protein
MQFNTLRRLGSISGRTIAAIALSSATVLALAPSAKAGDTASGAISVAVITINELSFEQEAAGYTSEALEMGTSVGRLTASNNSGTTWTIKAYSANGSALKGTGASTSSIGYKVIPVSLGSPNGILASETELGSQTSPTLLYTGSSNEAGIQLDIIVRTTAKFYTVKSDAYTDTITYIIANGS